MQLRQKQFNLNKKTNNNCYNRRRNMKPIHNEKPSWMSNIPYKKSSEQGKVNKSEQQGHDNINDHFKANPHINKAAF